ncbi:MAG: NAD(P)/FAD-dependent oxidoreductase [Polyangiaceae bacterium]|nr:NAD(P)/FAD-dependent oxidoreductase [Polyangiaceae bacterium]
MVRAERTASPPRRRSRRVAWAARSPPRGITPLVKRLVVVGGGFGGLTVCRALRGTPIDVTLVDRVNHHLFQPLLYQVAMAGLSPAEIAYPIRSAFRDDPRVRVLLGEVVAIDRDLRTVRLLDGETLGYDWLVVAVGAQNDWFGKESTWGARSLGLKSIDDAVEIRRRVLLAFEAAEREADSASRDRLLTFVVIGGGPTGVEVAGALAELARTVLARDFRVIRPESARVVLVERGTRLLPGGFDPRSAESAQRQLAELGVEVRLGAEVRDLDDSGVALADGRVECATVLWTAGVRARALTARLGGVTDRAGRVEVAQDCSLPGHPEVFVIGDAARFAPEGSAQALPGIAPVAIQQGRFVAEAIRRDLRAQPRGRFSYRDKGIMATIGRSRAVAEAGRLRFGGLLAWVAWLVIHLWYLIGFRNRFVVLFSWFWNYVAYRRGARLITGERAWERLADYGVGEEPRLPPPEDTQPGSRQ